ncbi:PAAR domain-containing protein [Pseudomonas sp. TCU-HL1]|uniref:PAAR domain-containing protein n=1 Tax=Pseudomonas sp. TCU-HL1 TaxID=1856685 RepID=UPI000AAFCB48|nr:PAAR domain-containing protein [Pseudomonas sp. TCU-HL1]
MKRYHITLGASTTAGGSVITASAHGSINDKAIALEGDTVACPACGSIGVIQCVGPRLDEEWNGKKVALENDLCLCQCSPPPRLIANQSLRCQVLGSGGGGAAMSTFTAPRAQPATPPPPPRQSLRQDAAGRFAALEEEEEEEEEEELEPGLTLRIARFFDGTGNNQANSALTAQCRRDDRQHFEESDLSSIIAYCARYGYRDPDADGLFRTTPSDSYGNAPSNVAYLSQLYPDNATIRLEPDAKTGYVPVYLEGIGTTSGGTDSLHSQITGLGETGILQRVVESPDTIAEQMGAFLKTNPGTTIRRLEFDIFGFSRGAAAARHFVNEVLKPNGGLLANTLRAGQFGLAAGFDWRRDVRIHFIGLFDTVAAVAAPPARRLEPGQCRQPRHQPLPAARLRAQGGAVDRPRRTALELRPQQRRPTPSGNRLARRPLRYRRRLPAADGGAPAAHRPPRRHHRSRPAAGAHLRLAGSQWRNRPAAPARPARRGRAQGQRLVAPERQPRPRECRHPAGPGGRHPAPPGARRTLPHRPARHA